jgi:hypothetical protein
VQTELAAKIGLSHRQYHKFEQGEFPKYKRAPVQQIDKLLGTNLYELIYESKSTEYQEGKLEGNEGYHGKQSSEINPEFAKFLLENDTWFKNQYATYNQQVLANLTALIDHYKNLEALVKINLEHTGIIEATLKKKPENEIHAEIGKAILDAAIVRTGSAVGSPGKG